MPPAPLPACLPATTNKNPPLTLSLPLLPSRPLQVFILPTIRINGVQYRGKMATAEVLRAICAGFVAGNTPQACTKVGGWGGVDGWVAAGRLMRGFYVRGVWGFAGPHASVI